MGYERTLQYLVKMLLYNSSILYIYLCYFSLFFTIIISKLHIFEVRGKYAIFLLKFQVNALGLVCMESNVPTSNSQSLFNQYILTQMITKIDLDRTKSISPA